MQVDKGNPMAWNKLHKDTRKGLVNTEALITFLDNCGQGSF